MQSLGERLRKERDSRTLTLEEAAGELRIRVRYLRALEEDDFDAFPTSIQARGFLRNYAQFLGMDAEEVLAQYGDLVGEPSIPKTMGTVLRPPLPAAQANASSQTAQRQAPTGQTKTQEAPLPELEQPSSPAAKVLRSSWFTALVLGGGLIAIAVWVTMRLSRVTFDDVVEESSSTFLEELASVEAVTPSPTFQPTSMPAPQAGPEFFNQVVLTIRVEQRAWARIVVDDLVAFEGQAEPNTVLQYEGAQSVSVLVGNGAGLNVTYNGREIGLLGERGEVVERLFTVEGEMTPTPTLMPTTTSTGVPTVTPTQTPTPRP